MSQDYPKSFSRDLLAWYDVAHRRLPWRAEAGEVADPYAVWLSEIMLQQTTVVTVKGYFELFLKRWPSVSDLAAADLDDVLHAWQGLGYYARARNLHKCARVVANEFDGRFPDSEETLMTLPGIGPYTAAAVAAIAFGRETVPVDGNIERVISRLYVIKEPLPGSKPRIKKLVSAALDRKRPGDYAQALMDLGATICTPRSPRCATCPVSVVCDGYKLDNAEQFPKKAPKKPKPTRRGIVFWAVRDDDAVLIRRRPEKGLLGGMMEFPSTDWNEATWTDEAALKYVPVEALSWQRLPGTVRHTFTHFHLELVVLAGKIDEPGPESCVWCPVERLSDFALPTVMKKVVNLAVAELVAK
ncbi:MAG: A/G-specific adenine glycosylase [Rhodospirillaceae bacterium]|jgi:A/G-specific adenine glycosylase|nr:A/G-specific adenine glycosylase [Rhodospirillales bacterium]MBT3907036.1 A/G-specific adenine glycosylase [Rhodospirillaceae bacterium]MBT4701650.1 A/G-specific adenine glycosylase [Rhodospirillaceae bacterium]MBT5035052.1 A/G-specific adenine glycosylase [Rhodospirillaceae bacterium]MBT6221291.1 A/G-specific adenine glycosylase [Rhodospirillaceae bacterium]